MHAAEVARLQIERDAAIEAARGLAAEYREREEKLRANIAEMETRLASQFDAERSALAENAENLERADASRDVADDFADKEARCAKAMNEAAAEIVSKRAEAKAARDELRSYKEAAAAERTAAVASAVAAAIAAPHQVAATTAPLYYRIDSEASECGDAGGEDHGGTELLTTQPVVENRPPEGVTSEPVKLRGWRGIVNGSQGKNRKKRERDRARRAEKGKA